MVLCSIRSKRQLMEQLNYNLLFRWFLGLEMDDPVWDATAFTRCARVKLRCLKRVDWLYRLTVTAYNLVGMRTLIPIQAIASWDRSVYEHSKNGQQRQNNRSTTPKQLLSRHKTPPERQKRP